MLNSDDRYARISACGAPPPIQVETLGELEKKSIVGANVIMTIARQSDGPYRRQQQPDAPLGNTLLLPAERMPLPLRPEARCDA